MRLRTYGWKHSVTAVDVRVRAPCNGKGKARLTTQTTSGLRPASDEVATWPDSENGARLEDTEFSLFQRLSGVRLDTDCSLGGVWPALQQTRLIIMTHERSLK